MKIELKKGHDVTVIDRRGNTTDSPIAKGNIIDIRRDEQHNGTSLFLDTGYEIFLGDY